MSRVFINNKLVLHVVVGKSFITLGLCSLFYTNSLSFLILPESAEQAVQFFHGNKARLGTCDGIVCLLDDVPEGATNRVTHEAQENENTVLRNTLPDTLNYLYESCIRRVPRFLQIHLQIFSLINSN